MALGRLMGFAIECPVKKSQNNQIKRGKQKDYTGNNESRKHSSVPLDGYGIKRVQVPELIEREFDFPFSVSLKGSRIAMEIIIKWKVHLPFAKSRNLTSQTDGRK